MTVVSCPESGEGSGAGWYFQDGHLTRTSARRPQHFHRALPNPPRTGGPRRLLRRHVGDVVRAGGVVDLDRPGTGPPASRRRAARSGRRSSAGAPRGPRASCCGCSPSGCQCCPGRPMLGARRASIRIVSHRRACAKLPPTRCGCDPACRQPAFRLIGHGGSAIRGGMGQVAREWKGPMSRQEGTRVEV